MKVELKKVVPTFTPVVITLESKRELDLLTKTVAEAGYNESLYSLFQALKANGGTVKS